MLRFNDFHYFVRHFYIQWHTKLNLLFLTEFKAHIDGLVQDCSNSIANALELLQSCAKPLIYDTD